MTYNTEKQKYHEQDKEVIRNATAWLSNFWWENRKSNYHPDYNKDRWQAEWETDRIIRAVLNLKS